MKAFVLLLLVTALLAGCGEEAAKPTIDSEGRYVVHLTSGNMMAPKHLSIPVGATVHWVVDGGLHDVTPEGDGSWGSKVDVGHDLTAGESYDHTFATAGTYTVFCFAHHSMGMSMTITVA